MKNSKYIIIALAFVAIAAGCSREEESLFEMSAAERAAYAINKADSTLLSATNGWEMLYTPSYDYRGYNLLVKFEENGGVKFAAKNSLTTSNKYEEDSNSTWNLVSNQGPILTFDTHNGILHKFCDPDEGGSALAGKGYEGDFEFLILRTTDNQMLLKGKKRGTYIIMNRLEEGLNWEDYFNQVEQASAKMFSNKNIMEVKIEDKAYTLFNGAEGIFYLTEKGEPVDELNIDAYPFANTREGITLTAGFLNNKQDRVYRLDGGVLRGENSTISSGNLNTYFDYYIRLNGMGMTIDVANIGSGMAAKIDAVNKSLKSVAGNRAAVKGLRFFYEVIISSNINIPSVHTFAIQFLYTLDGSTQETPVAFYYDSEINESGITLTYTQPRDATDKTGETLLNAVPTLADLLKAVNGTYVITTDNLINPSLGSKMTNSSNPDIWYNIKGSAK